jgi:hypothetical protein
MSTKPKGIVCYSADELNHFYIKGDGANSEMLVGYETTADDTELPIYLQSSTISILRGAVKKTLQSELDNIETTASGLDVAVENNETNLNTEIATARANETTNATAITTEQTRALAAESTITTTIDGISTSVGTTMTALQASIDAEVIRAGNAEDTNTTAITSLSTNTADNLQTESDARIAADATLTTDVATNANAISTEETRATTAETGLQSQITNLLSNVDGTTLKSLAELVSDYNANGATIQAS